MGLRDKLAELKRITGASRDPSDSSRWNVHGDFWWYRKWQEFQMHKDRGDVLDGEFWMLNGRLFTRNYWPEGIPAPPKPFGWDEWHAENRVNLTPLDEIRDRIKASLEQRESESKQAKPKTEPQAVAEPAPEPLPMPRGYVSHAGPVSALPSTRPTEEQQVEALEFLAGWGRGKAH